jgi:hypothetical protein
MRVPRPVGRTAPGEAGRRSPRGKARSAPNAHSWAGGGESAEPTRCPPERPPGSILTPNEPEPRLSYALPEPAARPCAPCTNRSFLDAERMYGPPRFCKVIWAGLNVGANVSGLSGEAQCGASGRHGDARVAGLVTRTTLRDRCVRQARATPRDGCGHAVHRLAETCPCRGAPERLKRRPADTAGSWPAPPTPSERAWRRAATVATLGCALACRPRSQAPRRSSRVLAWRFSARAACTEDPASAR